MITRLPIIIPAIPAIIANMKNLLLFFNVRSQLRSNIKLVAR